MPVLDPQDASDVEKHIRSVFASPPLSRANALRAMFVEKLDFSSASGEISLAGAPNSVTLPERAERLATTDGVTAVFVPLDIRDHDRAPQKEAAAAARLISSRLAGDLFLIMTNTSGSQVHFILPTFEGAEPYLRRLVIERDLPHRTAVEQLADIYHNQIKTGSIHQALQMVFDVEAVTSDPAVRHRWRRWCRCLRRA